MKIKLYLLTVVILIAAVVLSLGFSGCKTTTAAETTAAGETTAAVETTAAGPVKDTIVIGEAHNMRSLDPESMISGQEGCIAYAVYEGLVTYNSKEPANYLPSLAESWEV